MKRYPAYKDSGIEWIGEIPEHWEVTKLKYSDKVIMGQSPKSDDYNDTNEGLPFLQGNADFKTLFPKPKVWCETANKIAEKEDVLLSVRAPIGAVNIADQSYGIGRGLCAIRSKKSLAKLLFYLALSLNDELNSIGTGSTYTAVSIDDIANVFVPNIPHIEQQTIANYLDRKTHQIDTLIKNNQKLIDLLKEQRTAIINQAVTKGLDPNVKLKDSGIEWLGAIPEHWAVKKLKHVITIKSGEGITREDINEEGTYEVYGGNGFLGFTENYNVTNDTLIIGRVGAKCGNVHLVCDHKWVTDNALIAKTNQNYMFLFFLLTSMRLNNLANQNAQPLITGTMIKYQIAALPSIDEQDKIVENIKSETMRFDILLRNNQRQIDILKEYRTALISEVVTGKIDVRDSGEQEVRPS